MTQETQVENHRVCMNVIGEIFNGKRFEKVPEYYWPTKNAADVAEGGDPSFESHDSAHGDRGASHDEIRGMFEMYETAFPGYQVTLKDSKAWDDKVFLHWTVNGKHTGPFLSYETTHRDFAIDVMSVCTFVDGKISKVEQVQDMFGLLHQLGLLNHQRPLDD